MTYTPPHTITSEILSLVAAISEAAGRLEALENDPKITVSRLAKQFGVAEKTIKRDLEKLKTEGKIRRIGPAKGGQWQVVGEEKP